MIGIDLTKISRFQNSSPTLIKRILSELEIDEYKKTKNKAQFLATRWSIKEALYKANNSLYSFKSITIFKLNGIYMYKNYYISTSTEGDLCVAIVKEGVTCHQ